ncbi:hypothetical protein BGZ80_004308, partial [Entomortierella chlamydospora]
RFNMGYAEIEYETREEAQAALEGWNGGQLDGEIVDVVFITKITKVAPPAPRPVRSRVPPSPRRGGRARSPLPPPPPRRRGEGNIITHLLAELTLKVHLQVVGITIHLHQLAVETATPNPLPEGAVDLIVVRCHDHPSEAGREPVRLVLMGQEVAVAVAV